jgi:hypothetical protein
VSLVEAYWFGVWLGFLAGVLAGVVLVRAVLLWGAA